MLDKISCLEIRRITSIFLYRVNYVSTYTLRTINYYYKIRTTITNNVIKYAIILNKKKKCLLK